MIMNDEIIKNSEKNLKEHRIFGNRFTKEEYEIISNGLKKLKRKNLSNTDILLGLLKKEVRKILKNNIYRLKSKTFVLEDNEIEKILKLYFQVKYNVTVLPDLIKRKHGVMNFEFINTFNEKYIVVIFDKNKRKFKEKIALCSKKGKVILWDPANICQIKNIERIDIENVDFFIEQFKDTIFF